MPTIVAYLDVLGFSAYTEQDLSGALQLLQNQGFMLRQKLQDGKSHPAGSYSDPSLAAIAEAHLVDSFQHFLPFSDSTFIVSSNPDSFARQLSHFLIACLHFVGHVYDGAADPASPETVQITDIPSGGKHTEKWYPPLWRGGLATGDLNLLTACGISEGGVVQIPNLAGDAVVRAVRVEKAGKGPRLFCESGFGKIFGSDIQHYFRPVSDSVSELLWPAFQYNLNNRPDIEIFEFHKLWIPAVSLWKSKVGQSSFEHYDEFIKLLVRSLLCWADIAGCRPQALAMAKRHLNDDIAVGLVDSYLQ